MKIKNSNLYILVSVICIAATVIGMGNFSSSIYLKISSILSATNNVVAIILFIITIVDSMIYGVSHKKLIFFLISIPIMLLNFHFSISGLVLPYLFICAYPSDLNIKSLFKAIYVTIFINIIVILVLYFLGITQDSIGLRENGMIRHSFGFSSPNTLGNIIVITFLLKIMLYWKTWSVRDTCLWLGILLGMYHFTNSRMPFYIALLVLVIVVIFKYNIFFKQESKFLYRIPVFVFGINTFLSFFLAYYFQNHNGIMFDLVNRISSGRLNFMINFLNEYGISILGNKNIQFITAAQVRSSNNYLRWAGVDNSYIYISMVYGIVILFLFGVMYYFAEKYFEQTSNWAGIIYLIALAIIGLTENYMVNIAMNLLFFIFAEYLNSDTHTNLIWKKEIINQ